MNGFDSYRVRERADVGALGPASAPSWSCSGAFFRTQIIQHDKFQLKAETNRLRPIPLTPPRGAILDRRGRDHRRERPRLFRQAARVQPATRSARCWRRVGRFVPLDTSRDRRNPPPLRRGPLPAGRRVRRRHLRDGRAAGGASRRAAGPRHPVGAQAALSGRQGGGAPGRLRLRGDRVRPRPRTAFPAQGSARSWARRASSGSTTTRCAAPRGSATSRSTRAAGWCARRRAPPRCRRRRASRSSTTIDLDLQRFIDSIWPAGRPRRDGRDDAHGRGPRAVLGADLRSQRVRRRDLDRARGARSTTTRPVRCSTARSRPATRPPRRSSWRSRRWRSSAG